jgi:hypothetical protein
MRGLLPRVVSEKSRSRSSVSWPGDWDIADPRRRLAVTGVSVGDSDQALQRIGLVIVMAAGLDHQRMKILKRAVDVPVKTSADWPRKKLTRGIKDAFSQPPLDRLSSRIDDWLSEVDELLRLRDRYAHSRTFYEMRGDGTAGSFTHHPKSGQTTPLVDEPELDDEILRLSDASSVGSRSCGTAAWRRMTPI